MTICIGCVACWMRYKTGDGMKIVADQNILALESWFSHQADLVLLPGREITRKDLHDADALLVRSITRVDRKLLDNTPVKFVGTATSGTDHLDLNWLAQAGVQVADAAGANASAVAEYVLAVLAVLIREHEFLPWQKTVAVVGVGHVGSALIKRLRALGIQCVGCDPFNKSVAGLDYVSLEDALQADVVCLHTPLSTDGEFATRHMLDAKRLATMRPDVVLINAGRGEVIDSQALLSHAMEQPDAKIILDVWENEPSPLPALVKKINVGTPHIAGYSVEAKLAASRRVLSALCESFSLDMPTTLPPPDLPLLVHDERYQTISGSEIQPGSGSDEQVFADVLLRAFSPRKLSDRFSTKYLKGKSDNGARVFDKVRKELIGRREYSASHVLASAVSPQVASWLHASGFVLQA